MLLFLVGSGHNDALMVGLLVAGLDVARRGHPARGMAICALAGAIKIPGLAGAFAIAWTGPGTGYSLRRRARLLAEAVVISAATFEALSAVFGVGWGWLHTLGASDTVSNWITPADLVAKVVPTLSLGIVPEAGFLTVEHVIGPLVAAVVCVWAVRRLPTLGVAPDDGNLPVGIRAAGPDRAALVSPLGCRRPGHHRGGPHLGRHRRSSRCRSPSSGSSAWASFSSQFFSLPLLYQLLSVLVLAAAVVAPIRRVARRTAR